MTASALPPGLVDEHIEFFEHDGVLKALYNGHVVDFDDIPNSAKKLLMDEMHAQPEIMEQFFNSGVTRLADQLYTYAKCLYGGFNNFADITEAGLGNPDNHNCTCHGSCCLKDVVKHCVKVQHGYLTQREVEIVRLLTQNLMGKQIAGRLRITENTVNKHKQNIFNKTGLNSNVELVVWATNEHLV